VRILLLLTAVSATAVTAAGCDGSGKKTAPPPRWVQRANAICKRDDRRAEAGVFDSAAMLTGLHGEASDLARAGFFGRAPTARVDVLTAGRLLSHAAAGDFGSLRKADRALISARRDAARKGVHCSFAAEPLANL
jgi:hypothetical protein